MQLFFVRHGRAESRETWEGDDGDRPLTPAGRRAMAREAETFAALGVHPDVILTSPLARARETAEVVAGRLGLEASLSDEPRLAPGFGPAHLREILAERPEAGGVMLVGHEPDFSATIGALVGGAAVVCKKGSLARVDLDSEGWQARLVWLLQPRLLTLSATEEASGGD